MKNYILILYTSAVFLAACAQTIPADSKVIDGDSLKVDGENIRLLGYNTPETRSAQCESEKKMGYEAKNYLANLLAKAETSKLDYELKKNGDRKRDKYGRLLATLYIDGKSAGALLINAGLARPYDGGKRGSWCA